MTKSIEDKITEAAEEYHIGNVSIDHNKYVGFKFGARFGYALAQEEVTAQSARARNLYEALRELRNSEMKWISAHSESEAKVEKLVSVIEQMRRIERNKKMMPEIEILADQVLAYLEKNS